MKNNAKQIIIFLTIFVITFGVLYGIREFRMNSAEKSMEYEMNKGLLTESVRFEGENYLIPPTDIFDTGLENDSIPAISEPIYTTVNDADNYLADDVYGIDVEVDGDHRFYSFQIMNWHYVVNDEFNGQKLAITHCPLCLSSAVYKRELDGEELNFSVDPKVYNNNALLIDNQTESLWLQMRGMAISGDKIGAQLELYPSTIISWIDWKELYPHGEVLSTSTGYDRDYTKHPYTSYDTAKTIFFPLNEINEHLSSKWWVSGVELESGTMAFSQTILKGRGVVNEDVNGTKITAFYDNENDQVRIYSPILNGQELTFSYDFENGVIIDDQSASMWTNQGVAISGEFKGSKLERIASQNSFWFCWYAIHPDTMLSEVDLHPEQVE